MGGSPGRGTAATFACAIALALAAILAVAGSSSAGPGDAGIRIDGASQSAILEHGRVDATVRAPRKWTVRAHARIRGGRPNSKSAAISARTEVRVKAGTKRISLPLNKRGRRRVKACGAQTVIVQARVMKSSRERDLEVRLRDSRRIEADRPACEEEPPPGNSNKLFAVTPGEDEARHTSGTPRRYSASGLGAERVRIATFACANVGRAGPEFTFAGGAAAAPGDPGAGIASAGGTDLAGTPQQTNPKRGSAGRLAFTVSGGRGCAVPVIYRDADRNGRLAIDSGGIPTEPYGAGAAVSFEPQGFTPQNASRCDYFDTSECMYPFPSDALTTEDASTETGRRINFNVLSMPANRLGVPVEPTEYNRADGFSPGSMMITKVPGVDRASALANSGATPIDDLGQWDDPETAIVVIDAETGERHPVWAEIDANPEAPADRTVLIRPQRNFLEGHRYIVALRHMRDRQGELVPVNRGFQLLRDSIITSDPAIEGRRAHMEELFTKLGEAGIGRSDLNLAWDFTVAGPETLAGRMLAIRDAAFAELGDTNLGDMVVQGSSPTFTITGTEDFTTAEDGRIARRVEGTVNVPCFLAIAVCLPGGQFVIDPTTGTPLRIPGNVAPVSFICNIPHAAMAADGEPARPSLYGHGLLGSAGEVDGGNVKAMAGEHNMIMCATDWAGFSTKDAASIALILQDVNNFPKLADGSQQGFLNFLFLGRALIHPSGLGSDPAFQDAGGDSVIDTSRLFYDGNSQGGILGGALTAVAPDFDRAVLGVPGMNYSTLLRRSVDFDGYATGEIFGPDTPLGLYDNYPDELQRPLLLSLLQMLWDRAEANGYAQHMTADPYANTPPHEVLLHVAFGDHQVSNVTADVQARTIGAATNAPLDEGRFPGADPLFDIPLIDSYPYEGSGIVYFDSGSPNAPAANVPPREGADPHGHPRNDPAGRQQKSAFLEIDGKIVDVCNGGPCYANGYTGPTP